MKKRSTPALLLTGVVTLFFGGSGSAGVIVNTAVPFEQVQFVECANGGAGEEVLLTGLLHVLITETTDARGRLHTTAQFQPMGAIGIGSTTGDVYRATGATRETTNGLEIPFETTFVNNFRIIGPGTGNNLLIHEVFHVTVNAQGVVTVVVDLLSEDCR